MPPRFRVNGFQPPMSTDQQMTVVSYPLISIAYYCIVIAVEERADRLIATLLPHALLCVVCVSSWFIVESLDPIEMNDKTGIPVICFKRSKLTTRYCGTCQKPVYALDHHCTWLNTCIGGRNYVPFLFLIFSGFFQMGLQTGVGAAYMTAWFTAELRDTIRDSLPELWVYYTLMIAHCVVAGATCVAFGTLLCFHLYLLLWARMGTYEWLLSGHDTWSSADSYSESKLREEEQRRRQAELRWVETQKQKVLTLAPEGEDEIELGELNSHAEDKVSRTPPESGVAIVDIPAEQDLKISKALEVQEYHQLPTTEVKDSVEDTELHLSTRQCDESTASKDDIG